MTTPRQKTLLQQLLTDCVNTVPGKGIPPQDELSRKYGSSRTSIREALVILEFMGVIVVKPKIGTVVNLPKFWNLVPVEFVMACDEAHKRFENSPHRAVFTPETV